ncbi:SRPBCC family protein [Methylomarinum sp. Ch1-1]|uniref:SRPBCC family protein n=1 Tax=Methylomarinum roseum TaxID=3067653 RepID=A0AAU7NSK7_9GAMM|nr:SRPBCC family protein [Methylomarinum sp. Ch1-1]MDP4520039.1 SRPBCC family protein [Methylomarinum sp. Ch1-1]
MADFALTSIWTIPAPIERCWFCLLEKERWPDWWPYVDKVEQLRLGEANGVGNVCRYYWHTCLPYRLVVDITVTELVPFQYIGFSVDGDVRGHGACRLHIDRQHTLLQFDWRVSTNKAWMNKIAVIARPVFSWNHRRVMKKGEQSFIKRLNSEP